MSKTKTPGKFFGRFSRASMALVCAGFSALVLVLCVVAGLQFKRGAEQEFYRDTGNIARILVASFEEQAGGLNAILGQLATRMAQLDVSSANEPQLHELLTQYALSPAVIGPAIADANGVVIASARVLPVASASVKDRSIFRVHADNQGHSQLYISAPTQGLQTNEWSIQFSRALRDASGNFRGIVFASYRLSHFIGLYEKLKISNRGVAALTGKDGVVRIRSLSGTIGYGTSVSRMPLVFERVLAGEMSGTFHGRSYTDKIVRIGSFVTSQTTPFYVTVGYDEDFLRSRYIEFFTILGICWATLTAGMIAAVVFVRSLEKIRQRAQLEVVQSAIAERQNLSADMHDSIGASLATLLAHFTSAVIDPAVIKRRIGEILMELRFLVDSAEPVDGDVALVLSSVRHRMGRGIELAGIDLRWRVDDLPRVPALTNRDALAVKLALMEALTNVIHHSKAKTAGLSAAYDAATSTLTIAVTDDGCGFDIEGASGGRGISNMRRRIQTISTGGLLAIESAPGKGTTITIELKAPQSALRAA